MKRLFNWLKVVGLMAVLVGVVSYTAPGLTVAASHASSPHKVTTMFAPTYPYQD